MLLSFVIIKAKFRHGKDGLGLKIQKDGIP